MATDEEQQALLGDAQSHIPTYTRNGNNTNTTHSTEKEYTTRIVAILPALTGVFLAQADTTFLLVTQQSIASSFQNVSFAPLLLVSYSLGYSVALPVYGALGDIYGCKGFILSAFALFGTGCLISGIATTAWQFICGRILSGMGGAGMIDLISALLIEIFGVSHSTNVRSYVIIANVLGQSCGGFLGAALADTIGWRWSLIGQAPITMMCLAVAKFSLPPSNRRQVSEAGIHLSEKPGMHEIDYFGIGTFAISVSSFTLALAADGAPSLDSLLTRSLLLGASIISGLVFALNEFLWAKYPILPKTLLTAPSMAGIFLGQCFLQADLHSILPSLDAYFSRIDGTSNSQTAILILPASFGFVTGTIFAGKIINKTGSYQWITKISMCFLLGIQILLCIRWADGIRGLDILYLFPWCFAAGIVLSTQFTAMSTCAPDHQIASATAVFHLCQRFGSICGTSMGAAALRWSFRTQLEHNLKAFDIGDRVQLINRILHSTSFSLSLVPDLHQSVQRSFILAYRIIPQFALGCAVIGLPILFFHRERKLH